MRSVRQFGRTGRQWLMPSGGTTSYSNPGQYQSKGYGAQVDFVFGKWGDFKARLTWVELRHLHLFHSQENLPRVSYVSLTPERVFIAFPTHSDPPQIWGGVKLTSGDIVIHGRGERMHQRTMAASRWGFVSLTPERLVTYCKSIAGLDLVPPPVGRVLRPSKSAKALLLRLHAQACQLAETRPAIIAHREIARALEQDLVRALVNCLTASEIHDHAVARRHHWSIMAQFEDALAVLFDRRMHVSDLCAAMGVPERTLRGCCAEVLGMGPSRYLRLRQLNMVHATLRRADPETTSVSEVARRFGFSELGRFAATYRTVFDETPSTTLRSRSVACDTASAESA